MCNLNEAWAVVYFQVAVLILIFGLGIPSLAQAFVTEDIRRMIYRRWKFFRWAFLPLPIILYMAIALIFVWVIHPCDDSQPSLLQTFGLDVNHLLAGNITTWISDGAITIAIITAGIALYFQDIHRRDKMLNGLRGDCERNIGQKGIPDDQVIEDIRYLGEQGKTRGEKVQALEILERLSAKVQAHKRYQGDGLEAIIEAIEFIVQTKTDVDCFMEGILILKSIAEKSQTSEYNSFADRNWVLRLSKDWGLSLVQ